MTWWKDADKRKIPSPAEVRAMMGYGPEPALPRRSMANDDRTLPDRIGTPTLGVKVVRGQTPAGLARLPQELFSNGPSPSRFRSGSEEPDGSECVGIAHDCRCAACELGG